MFIFGLQKTSANCTYVFKMPSPNLIKRHIPSRSTMSKKMRAQIATDAQKEEDSKKTSETTTNLNDRVNEQYLSNPVEKFHSSNGYQNRRKADTLLWKSVGSQPSMSDDGRVTRDKNARDLVTPGYMNSQMSDLTNLMSNQMSQSKVASYMHEISDVV